MAARDNIAGTSTKTPTTVASAAPECIPKREIAVLITLVYLVTQVKHSNELYSFNASKELIDQFEPPQFSRHLRAP